MTLIKTAVCRLKAFILKITAPALKRWEEIYFKSLEAPSPVFIIGAPRTGSTILYQALTNAYQLAYIDNLACAWHRNLRFGMLFSKKKYRNKPHNNFIAKHGNTREFGGHAPSECGQFWYRWLPRDRHFVDYNDITDKMVDDIRGEVLGASAYLKQPLLFKNLNVGQRLRLIHKCFPNARIIFVRRDPRFVVRSILKAREVAGVEPHQWWSIIPKNVDKLLDLSEAEMCAAQVYYLEKQIEADIKLFPACNVRSIHYQELSEHLLADLANWLGVESRPQGSIPQFKQDDIKNLDKVELEHLSNLVSQYEFTRESFV
ncbi:sulfotransferase [Idiomarina abyssalis]|uniref:sulfotransferase n=1 Tax=Idiomarina abyssalis TaxID=86102 RepID=UPI00230179C3|nr:sulfotransferase [Idiomarina abyssalis]MDA6067156.1 sulfotransferase [Idiomarina abyssalis]